MDNYDFCAQWAHGRSLDYGCGAGELVRKMRARGLDAWGCDTYYEGGDSQTLIGEDVRPYLVRMTDRIPFDTASFDCIVSNTVLEHVEDMDAVLAEIARVLKPGGASLHLFPHLECWREGHCEIPLLHRFPRGAARLYYAAAWRALGFGAHHKDKPIMQWSRDFCAWIDQWTHYRPLAEIQRLCSKHFRHVEHIEAQWLGARSSQLSKLPAPIRRLIARKMAGLVLVLRH